MIPNAYPLARGLHVISVVLWIGGVSFVTLVLLPTLRRQLPLPDQYPMFERLERPFAAQARVWVALAFLTGWWMLELTGGWARLWATPWLLVMASAWVPFALMLFVLEPLVVHRLLADLAVRDPAAAMSRVQLLHVGLLAWSLAAVGAAVMGAHGGW